MTSDSPRPRNKRVSLACIPCRQAHSKCDATRPYCRRCSSCGKQCYYERSRRGGLDRETLAARRSRVNRDAESSGSSGSARGLESHDASSDGVAAPRSAVTETFYSGYSSSASDAAAITALLEIPLNVSDPIAGAANDPLIDLYYEHFHRFHPCLLPKRHLYKRLQDPDHQAYLESLLSVVRFIGSIYGRWSQSSQLKERARKSNSDQQCPGSALERAFLAQSRLLLSISLYWSTDMEESRLVMDRAIRDAFELGMYRRQFAAENAGGDRVLEECLRRTWWQIVSLLTT